LSYANPIHAPGRTAPPAVVAAGSRWDSLLKAVHWSIALLILLEVPAGFVMSMTYGPSFKDATALKLHVFASQFHHTVGFLVLAVALFWIARRLRRGRPAWDDAVPRGQRILASGVHGVLLALLVLVPWSGWTALSALADSAAFGATHIWFFGFDRVLPRIWEPLPFDDPSGYARFGRLHVWGLWAGLAVLTLHVAAALWHHAFVKDGVLRRMWPLGDGPHRH
jgi:cytochrome b561